MLLREVDVLELREDDRRHMLALRSYEGVRFVTPGDFLGVLRSSTS